jgi:SPP1 gp7 family putative phage head morphogenesis protein
MEQYHRDADKTIYTIQKAYDKAIRDIDSDVKTIIEKFSLDSGLTPSEVRQLLNTRITTKEMDELRKMIASIKDEDTKKYLLARLNSNAYRARLTRLEALKESINIRIKEIAPIEVSESSKVYIDILNKSYYTNTFDIQKGLGLGFNIAQMPNKVIEEILKNPWSGKQFSSRVWSNTTILAEKLNEVITSGFISGRSYRDMSKDIDELNMFGKNNSMRLIRTEATYFANQGEMESYKEIGIDKYIYVATLDTRTSDVCREHDGKVYNVKDAIPGENMPSLHPNCRSTTRAYLGEDTLKGIQRRARNLETGKNYLVPASMTYNEWYKEYVEVE